MEQRVHVRIIFGSENDIDSLNVREHVKILREIGAGYEVSVLSAHRHPEELHEYCILHRYDTDAFIGVAGMSAALPGAIASYVKPVPVFGVPVVGKELDGLDALFSMVRMPPGVPVAVCGIGETGLKNTLLFICQLLSQKYDSIRDQTATYYLKESYKKAPQIDMKV